MDALQLVGLREEEERREIRRESVELTPAGPRPIETHLVFSKDLFVYAAHGGLISLMVFDGIWFQLTCSLVPLLYSMARMISFFICQKMNFLESLRTSSVVIVKVLS